MSWVPLLLALQASTAQAPVVHTVSVEPGFEVAGHRLGDLEGDGDAELVVVAHDGRVRAFRPLSEEPGRALGTLLLDRPERALLDLARWDGRTYLVVATPDGTRAHAVDEHGVATAESATWIPRGRFTVRLAAPSFARIAEDVNQDGVADLLVPTLGGVELWQARLEPGKPPAFQKAATVAVEIGRGARRGFDSLSDELASTVTIPGLDTRDVNGDGRPDLIVEQDGRRAWHLQREDASFPLEADVTLDLELFQDTNPAPTNSFGTIAGSDGASFHARDLDGDAVPDYVVTHRRKVWIFLGGAKGPQFTEPSQILITAEDVSASLVLPLDGDERPDLLFLKLQIPTVATLLRGLFGEWDVSVRALAYKNVGGGKFETRPELTNDLALRLPGIIGIMKAPERLVQRFEDLEKRFRGGARGDLDGDGAEDLVLVTAEEDALELWRGSGAAGTEDDSLWLSALLFGEKDAVWDVDRILTTLGGLAERQAARLVGDRPADARLPLRKTAEAELLAVECADLDGDGAREVVLTFRRRTAGREGLFDVLRFERER